MVKGLFEIGIHHVELFADLQIIDHISFNDSYYTDKEIGFIEQYITDNEDYIIKEFEDNICNN